MKRATAIFTAAALAVSLFTGCKNTAPAENTDNSSTQIEEETSETGDDAVSGDNGQTEEDAAGAGTEESSGEASEETADLETADADEGFTAPETPDIDENGYSALYVHGTQLYDTYGEPVQLKGVSTHGINWFDGYVNSDFFNELKNDWNADVIRISMYVEEPNGYCSEDGDPERLKEIMKNGIDYATEAGMYVIVDWHMGSTDWSPLQHEDEAMEFFDEISKEYSDHNNVIYEICNEPWDPTTWDDIKQYAESVIPVIRSNAPGAVVLVGTPHWSQYVTLAGMDPLDMDNIMYVFHFYAATHKDGARDTLKKALAAGLPVFVTEFGTCAASGNGDLDLESAGEWIDLMDENGISYCIWNVSNKDESSALIRPECDKVSGFGDDDLTEQGLWYRQLLNEK